MADSAETISELIRALVESGSQSFAERIDAEFPAATFGVLVQHAPGNPAADAPKTMSFVADPTGRHLVKACADPSLFERAYPGSFNALVTGQALIEMVLKVPEAAGVLVCSATSFHSYAIYRERFPDLSGARKRSWWPFQR